MTIDVIYVFELVHAGIRFFIVMCVLYSNLTRPYKCFRRVCHPQHEQLNNPRFAIGGFSKTIFCMNVYQHTYLYSCSEFPNYPFY